MFKLEFETTNDAFGESKFDIDREIENILHKVGRQVRSYGRIEGPIFDANGNKIGRYELTEDE